MLSPLNQTSLKSGTSLHVEFSKLSLVTICAASSLSHHQAAHSPRLRQCTIPLTRYPFHPTNSPLVRCNTMYHRTARCHTIPWCHSQASLQDRRCTKITLSSRRSTCKASLRSRYLGSRLDTALVDERFFLSRMRLSCSSNVPLRHSTRQMGHQSWPPHLLRWC